MAHLESLSTYSPTTKGTRARMCGLVGLAGDTTGTWKDIFSNLLIVDSLRGTHSTGAAFVSRVTEDIKLAKEVGHPFNLLQSKMYNEILKLSNKVMIGHNRYATKGEHTEDNAHPFAFPTVVGAHNGTLDNSCLKELHDYDKFGTDSEAIYSNINKYGVEDTIKRLSGAWALTWYDKTDNTINMIRNNKRPLYYAYSEDGCTLLWASEVDMLKAVINRSYKKVRDNEWYELPVNTWYSWEIPDSIAVKFNKPKAKELKGKESIYQNRGSYFHDSRDYYWQDYGKSNYKKQQQQNNNVVEFPNQLGKGRKDTTNFRPPYKNADNKVLNKAQVEELMAGGCVFCGDATMSWGEFIQPLKTSSGEHSVFLCEACYNDEEIHDICQHLI